METQFKILQIKELPFQVKHDVELTQEDMNNVKISFLIVLQHRSSDNVIGLHTMVRYMHNENDIILESGVTHIAMINEWDSIKNSTEAIKTSTTIKELLGYATAFISGLVYRQTDGCSLHNYFIPFIPSEDLISNLKIEQVE